MDSLVNNSNLCAVRDVDLSFVTQKLKKTIQDAESGASNSLNFDRSAISSKKLSDFGLKTAHIKGNDVKISHINLSFNKLSADFFNLPQNTASPLKLFNQTLLIDFSCLVNSLQTLDLSQNPDIKHSVIIKLVTFFPQLKTLNLSNTGLKNEHLTTITVNSGHPCFSQLKELQILNLSSNFLVLDKLPNNFFSKLSNLEHLDMRFNQFSAQYASFGFVSKKTINSLANKNTISLPNLSECKKLKTLLLEDYNGMATSEMSVSKDITDNIFGQNSNLLLENLETISFRHLGLKNFDFTSSSGKIIKNLKVLDLSFNSIDNELLDCFIYQALESGTLQNLEILNFGGNKIKNFDFNKLKGTPSLRILNLRANDLDILPVSLFFGIKDPSSRIFLSNLEILDVSFNKNMSWKQDLVTFDEKTQNSNLLNALKLIDANQENVFMSKLPNLKKLSLASCPQLQGFPKLQSFALNLEILFKTFFSSHEKGNLNCLESLDLSFNENWPNFANFDKNEFCVNNHQLEIAKLFGVEEKCENFFSSPFNFEENLEEQLKDHFMGSFFGSFLGDSIGLGTEFLSKRDSYIVYGSVVPMNYDNFLKDSHRGRWIEGDFTDDSDQSLLIVDTFLNQAIDAQEIVPFLDYCDFGHRLISWINHGIPIFGDKAGFGLGATVSRVVHHPMFLIDPHEAATEVWIDSGKKISPNGSMMRTFPCGLLFPQPQNYKNKDHKYSNKEEREKIVIQNAKNIGKVTHIDPKCVAGTIFISLFHFEVQEHFNDKYSDSEARKETIRNFILEDLDEVLLKIKEKSIKVAFPDESSSKDLEIFEHYFSKMSKFSELELDEPSAIGYSMKCFGALVLCLKKLKSLTLYFPNLKFCDIFDTILKELVLEAGDADTNAIVALGAVGAVIGFSNLPKQYPLAHVEFLKQKLDLVWKYLNSGKFV